MEHLLTALGIVGVFNKNIKVDGELTYIYNPFEIHQHPHLYSLKKPAYLLDGTPVIEVNEWDEVLALCVENVPALDRFIELETQIN